MVFSGDQFTAKLPDAILKTVSYSIPVYKQGPFLYLDKVSESCTIFVGSIDDPGRVPYVAATMVIGLDNGLVTLEVLVGS